jgi:hypothetical protein
MSHAAQNLSDAGTTASSWYNYLQGTPSAQNCLFSIPQRLSKTNLHQADVIKQIGVLHSSQACDLLQRVRDWDMMSPATAADKQQHQEFPRQASQPPCSQGYHKVGSNTS